MSPRTANQTFAPDHWAPSVNFAGHYSDGDFLYTVSQSGSNVAVESSPPHHSCPAAGRVMQNHLCAFGLTGMLMGDRISWSNGVVWKVLPPGAAGLHQPQPRTGLPIPQGAGPSSPYHASFSPHQAASPGASRGAGAGSSFPAWQPGIGSPVHPQQSDAAHGAMGGPQQGFPFYAPQHGPPAMHGAWPMPGSPAMGSPMMPGMPGSPALWSPQGPAHLLPPNVWQPGGHFAPGFFPGSAASGHFPPGAMVPASPSAYGEEVVQVEEVEALSRRVREVLRQCNDKLVDSRSGMEEMSVHRNGFALHLREAEEDFQRMGYDWHNIENELKQVRATLLKDANFAHVSPRSRSKILDAMLHDKASRDLTLAHIHDVGNNITEELAQEELRELREEASEEYTDPSTLAAILSAAKRSSKTEEILNASRSIAESSMGNRSPRDRSSPGASNTPGPSGSSGRTNEVQLQDVKRRSTVLEQQLERLRVREDQLQASSERRKTWSPREGETHPHRLSVDSVYDRDEEVLLPMAPDEGARILGDALVEDLLRRPLGVAEEAPPRHQRSTSRHRTMPAGISALPPSPYSDNSAYSPAADSRRRTTSRY